VAPEKDPGLTGKDVLNRLAHERKRE